MTAKEPPGRSSTHPKAPCPEHSSPVARIEACVNDAVEGSSVRQDRDSRPRPVCRARLFRRVFAYGFWVSRPREKGTHTRPIPRATRSVAQYILDRKSAACNSEKYCRLTAWRAVAAAVGGRKN